MKSCVFFAFWKTRDEINEPLHVYGVDKSKMYSLFLDTKYESLAGSNKLLIPG